MIEVEARVAQRKIANVAKELEYVSTATFLRGLGLNIKAQEALSYLKEIFPDSSKRSGSVHNQNEFGMHLRDGFYAESYSTGAKIGFFIGHELASNSRAAVILDALNRGTGAYSVLFDDPVHFLMRNALKGKGKGSMIWATLGTNRAYEYSSREGTEYVDKTDTFIRNVLIPKVKLDFAAKVAARMEKI